MCQDQQDHRSHGSSPCPYLVPPEFSHLPADRHRPFAYHPPPTSWGSIDDPLIRLSATEYSLIFVVDRPNAKVLLGLKRRGMGVNLYNGFGGKPEESETMLQCARRELEEESGLIPSEGGLLPKGMLYSARPLSALDRTDRRKSMIKIHLFACIAWSGVPVVTEEMIPEWFEIPSPETALDQQPARTCLPIDQMWPEASFYLQPILDSILQGRHDELFWGRINYESLSLDEAPTNLPALDGITLRRSAALGNDGNDDAVGERLGGWWMCLASNNNGDEVEQVDTSKTQS